MECAPGVKQPCPARSTYSLGRLVNRGNAHFHVKENQAKPISAGLRTPRVVEDLKRRTGTCVLDRAPSAGQMARHTRELGAI